MSRVLPILFNTDMVRAILDGRKTVTRRVVGEKVTIVRTDQEINKNQNGKFELYNITPRCGIPQNVFLKPPYQTDDILYVRETWYKYTKCVGEGENCRLQKFYGYKASIANFEDANEKWYPSIHMPREAARIWLKVTDVRVERLQDITWQQAAKEGCYVSTSDEADPLFHLPTLRGEFKKLWNSTLKKSDLDTYGWNANPWVWVIEFERCEKPESEE